MESLVVSLNIGISYRPDHSPVNITHNFSDQVRGQGTCKFDNSLLSDPVFVDMVKQTVLEVITEFEYDTNENLENPNKRFVIDEKLLCETITFRCFCFLFCFVLFFLFFFLFLFCSLKYTL